MAVVSIFTLLLRLWPKDILPSLFDARRAGPQTGQKVSRYNSVSCPYLTSGSSH